MVNTELKCLILDFSALSYIDPSGSNGLKFLAEEFQRIEIPIYIAGCSGPVYEMLEKCSLLSDKPRLFRVFPTVHDAVHYANSIYGDSSANGGIRTISRL